VTSDIDVAAADRLLTTTRAVRRRLGLEHPVERQVLLDCTSVARQAPAGIPVAHCTGETFSPAARPPAETVTHWDGWTWH
jgi:hypothetical protein